VRYRRGSRLDTSQVEDVRGRGGMGRLPGGGVAVGGGGLGIAGLVIYLLVTLLSGGGGLGGGLSNLDGSTVAHAPPPQVLGEECRTGADANAREDCRIIADVNSIQRYWETAFSAGGRSYEPASTVFFTGSTSTACGEATSEVGPFYCPADRHVYIDLGFFDVLRSQFGARGGPFAQAYVLAHEYGHHVQDLLGALSQGSSQAGAEGRSVRTELQAACPPAVPAPHAVATAYLVPPTCAPSAAGLSAAAAVGDDRIQRRAQGRVDPETWTHGSAAQRQRWFQGGSRNGDAGACDTFKGAI
jgi:predicted metalloprotease